jgi:hypothetical protein
VAAKRDYVAKNSDLEICELCCGAEHRPHRWIEHEECLHPHPNTKDGYLRFARVLSKKVN